MDERLLKATFDLDEYHWWYRGRRRIIHAELGRLPLAANLCVLDAGCGSGRTLPELERYGHVSGIELSPEAAERSRARGNFDVYIGRLEQLPWNDGTFDLITCLDVIEHTPDDRVALAELRRVCNPDGWLLVTVPAYPALWSHHDEASHHYRRYTRGSLRSAATSAGWQVDRLTSFNSLLLAPAAVVRLSQRWWIRPVESPAGDLEIGPAWLNGALERLLQLEARLLSRGRTLPAGLSLLAVMRPAGGQRDTGAVPTVHAHSCAV